MLDGIRAAARDKGKLTGKGKARTDSTRLAEVAEPDRFRHYATRAEDSQVPRTRNRSSRERQSKPIHTPNSIHHTKAIRRESMRKIPRSRLFVSLTAAAAISLAVPGIASATDNSVNSTKSASYATCYGGGVVTAIETVNIRLTPSTTAPVVATAQQGSMWNCDGYVLGARYNACGVTQANGWIYMGLGDTWGYSAMTCWK